jgi:hypothetical protein
MGKAGGCTESELLLLLVVTFTQGVYNYIPETSHVSTVHIAAAANVTSRVHIAFICFVWISKQTAIISLYNINWLVCITETGCVYCAVRTGSLTFNNSTFCPHSVFMCFVWISEQTVIISLYSINWLVCITETECVYCAVRTESLKIIRVKQSLGPYCNCGAVLMKSE